MAINISSFFGAGVQFFDDNGVPLAGGLLYVYAAGTTTPATTYTTSSGAVSNTNPIVLDSAGRPPNEIWINGGVLYKYVLKTSTGTLIDTYDNIPSINDPTTTNNLITVTGTNTLIGVATPAITAYVAGATYSFIPPNTNTGAVTIDISGLGGKNIYYDSSTSLAAGAIQANKLAWIEYDGTRFQMLNANLAVTTSMIADGAVTTAKLSTDLQAATYGYKNRLINGNMVIDQRNLGASVTAVSSTNPYSVDRWNWFITQNSKFSIQQNAAAVTPPAGFTNYLGVTSLSNYSVLAGDTFVISQIVEGYNFADFAWGTANAQAATLSFWVRSSLTGTFGGSIKNTSVGTYEYTFSYSIPVANAWTKISITVPGPTAGTWVGATNGIGVVVGFSMGTGSTFSNTAGSWVAGEFYSATGAVSVVGTSGATWYITGAQLEKGSTATSFDFRDYSHELIMCQRYCYKIKPTYASEIMATGMCTSTTSAYINIPFPVTMRAGLSQFITSATVSDYRVLNTAGAFIACSSFATNISGTVYAVQASFPVAAGLVAGSATFLGANTGTNGSITIACEFA